MVKPDLPLPLTDSCVARPIQRFEVSLKAFIVRGDKALFLRERATGLWELPGGRIEVGEEQLDHRTVLDRELVEELGPTLKVRLGARAVTWTRAHPGEDRYVFLIARRGTLVAGEPQLSSEHDALTWLDEHEWHQLSFPGDSGYLAAIERLWRVGDDAN